LITKYSEVHFSKPIRLPAGKGTTLLLLSSVNVKAYPFIEIWRDKSAAHDDIIIRDTRGDAPDIEAPWAGVVAYAVVLPEPAQTVPEVTKRGPGRPPKAAAE
jgi:hypothetical protein